MIRRLVDGWTRYWFRPAPLLDIAVVRIVIVGYQLWHLLARDYQGRISDTARLPDGLYEPLAIVRVLVAPVGEAIRPPEEVMVLVLWLTAAAGGLALIGLLTNLTLGLFAAGNLFIQGFLYSFGDHHHGEGLVMIALVALALGPSGSVLSLDHFFRRWRGGIRSRPDVDDILGAESVFARWPLLLTRWVFALIYLSAAYLKVRWGGLDWLNGHTLKYYVARDALRQNIDLGMWLADQQWLIVSLSWFTLLFEGSFFLVLFFPVLALIYVPAGAALHLGIHFTIRAGFFGFLACYSVFVPWHNVLQRLVGRTATKDGIDPGS